MTINCVDITGRCLYAVNILIITHVSFLGIITIICDLVLSIVHALSCLASTKIYSDCKLVYF